MTRDQIQTVLDALQGYQPYAQVGTQVRQKTDESIAILQAALAEPSEPVYWQWRRKDKPWANEYIFAMELQATTDDSEVRQLFTHPASKVEPLTDEEIFSHADTFGAFQYGDAQGDKRLAFARAIEQAVWEKMNGK